MTKWLASLHLTDLLIVLLDRKLEPNRSVSEADASFDSSFGSCIATCCIEAGGRTAPRRLIFLRSISSSPVSILCDVDGSWVSVLQKAKPVEHGLNVLEQGLKE